MGLLPKPGAWMEKFKVAMGFPMLATAVLADVALGQRPTRRSCGWGFSLVVLALAAWIWGQFVQRAARRKGLAAADLPSALLASDCRCSCPGMLRQSTLAGLESRKRCEERNGPGIRLLVDFTAKSCLTCQVNKAIQPRNRPARAPSSGKSAPWRWWAISRAKTRPSARNWRLYDRSGVPLVLVYSKDTGQNRRKSCPLLLTPSIVLDALDQAAREIS